MGGTIDLEYFKDFHGGKNYTSVPKGGLGSLDMPPSCSLLHVESWILISTVKPRLECCDINPQPPSGNSVLLPRGSHNSFTPW